MAVLNGIVSNFTSQVTLLASPTPLFPAATTGLRGASGHGRAHQYTKPIDIRAFPGQVARYLKANAE